MREPSASKVAALLAAQGGGARAARVPIAAGHGEVIVLATPWDATREVIEAASARAGKVLLDCTNPLAPGRAELTHGHSTSGAEQVAAWAEGARVVKIFNSTGSNNMADPTYGGERATMFFCGDDEQAKETAADLATDLGFEPVDAGGLSAARLLEPLALLWIQLAHERGMGREIAFKLMRR